jgi:hypothetical protein
MTMNPYLAKLRALEAKHPPPTDVGGFVSFVSAQSSPIPESAIPQEGRAPTADHGPATNPETLERRHLREPTKLTKPTVTPPKGGFVSFVGAQSRPISKFEISKSASSENRQNRQNAPQFLERLHHVLDVLDGRCPDYIEPERWRQAVEDGRHFLARWGTQAQAFSWTVRDMFGLHKPPEEPHPSYRRLSRYDATGLIWLLEGREVIALAEETATIRWPSGAVTVYRKHNKPALGSLGDSLDDFQ